MIKFNIKKKKLSPRERIKNMGQREKLHTEWLSLRKEVDSLLLTFSSEDFERWDDIENRKVEIAKSLRKIEEKILNII